MFMRKIERRVEESLPHWYRSGKRQIHLAFRKQEVDEIPR
jgi:hypothetical protein